MNTFIARWVFFFPVRFMRREPILRTLLFVTSCRVYKREEIQAQQLKYIRKLVEDSYRNVPFFRKHWKDVFNSDWRLSSLEDFSKIPLLQKSDVQSNSRQLRNHAVKRFDVRTTSGSTGTPLKFIKDREATSFMDAIMYDAYSWHDIKIGDRQARFWGMPHGNRNRIIAKFKDFLMNRKRLSAFQLSKDNFLEYAKLLKRWKPQYCYGYPSLLCEFASFIQKHEVELTPLEIKAVICTGEQLKEQQRVLLSKTFNCPVINEYGCTEVGVMGFECRHGNMHEMSPNIYLEVLDEGGRPVIDQEGEVVVTELHAKTSPFIRYKTGDRGIRTGLVCPCGLPYPVISILSGRLDDYIITPEGKKIYDAILAYTLKKGISSFKAVQQDIKTLEIMFVPNQDFSEDLLQRYMTIFQNHISENMCYYFRQVNDIPREPSGKLRYFVSTMKQHAQ